jgi:hypothetical protein
MKDIAADLTFAIIWYDLDGVHLGECEDRSCWRLRHGECGADVGYVWHDVEDCVHLRECKGRSRWRLRRGRSVILWIFDWYRLFLAFFSRRIFLVSLTRPSRGVLARSSLSSWCCGRVLRGYRLFLTPVRTLQYLIRRRMAQAFEFALADHDVGCVVLWRSCVEGSGCWWCGYKALAGGRPV